MLAFERNADPPLNAFPSFHTIWAILTAELLVVRNRRTAWLWRLWALGVAASCVATGMHWIASIVAGALLSLALIHIRTVWNTLLAWTGGVANSWREWQLGPSRSCRMASTPARRWQLQSCWPVSWLARVMNSRSPSQPRPDS